MNLIEEFYKKVKNIDFNVVGLFCSNKDVLTLGSDSKLIGRIFELLSFGILTSICQENNWSLEETESQTVYPDYTIITDSGDKIAVDIKTTYRRYNKRGEIKKFGFTLGAFASFLRNNTKNIAYPYNEYKKHYVIGFVYDRNVNAKAGKVKHLNESIEAPYNNVEFFIQEKYKIAGEKPGSGNTENIGSILSANIQDFIEGNGIFSSLGNGIFEDYWRGYPRYRSSNKDYTTLIQYLEIKKKKNTD